METTAVCLTLLLALATWGLFRLALALGDAR